MSSPGKMALRAGLLLISLALWEAATRLLEVPAFILPAPSSVVMALYRGGASGVYLDNLWVTLAETLLGFAFGSLLAFVFGTAVAVSRMLEYFLYPYIVMF
ncbi:MAG TPA: ABC transporter permease, partial [Alphaproteobacteria bacterium]|nr:ABC transporter permease [Alphaproteobacteria bacterium]